jgi:cobalamin biosynthesis protein CobW
VNDRAQCLVVCGFLGSGKTTLVRRLLEEGQREGIRTAVVSNEFGELGIDEALLASTGGDFVELAGGCVCCRLSDDLLLTLQQLWEKARPQRVIVETSGLALPYDTLVNFWRDPVRAWSTDESSVVVVSAEQLAAERDLDATFEDQVASADLLLLSKTDLLSDQDATRAEETLRALRPGTPVVRATRGDVDPRVFFPPEPGSAPSRTSTQDADRVRDHAAHAHDDYASEELMFEAGIDEATLLARLEAKPALRAKGFVETAAGLRLVQGVAGRVELTPVAEAPRADLVGRVVVIERRAAGSRHPSSQHASPRHDLPRGGHP